MFTFWKGPVTRVKQQNLYIKSTKNIFFNYGTISRRIWPSYKKESCSSKFLSELNPNNKMITVNKTPFTRLNTGNSMSSSVEKYLLLVVKMCLKINPLRAYVFILDSGNWLDCFQLPLLHLNYALRMTDKLKWFTVLTDSHSWVLVENNHQYFFKLSLALMFELAVWCSY